MARNSGYTYPVDDFIAPSPSEDITYNSSRVRSALRVNSSAETTEDSEKKRVRWQSPKVHRYDESVVDDNEYGRRKHRSRSHPSKNHKHQPHSRLTRESSASPGRASQRRIRDERELMRESSASPGRASQGRIRDEKEASLVRSSHRRIREEKEASPARRRSREGNEVVRRRHGEGESRNPILEIEPQISNSAGEPERRNWEEKPQIRNNWEEKETANQNRGNQKGQVSNQIVNVSGDVMSKYFSFLDVVQSASMCYEHPKLTAASDWTHTPPKNPAESEKQLQQSSQKNTQSTHLYSDAGLPIMNSDIGTTQKSNCSDPLGVASKTNSTLFTSGDQYHHHHHRKASSSKYRSLVQNDATAIVDELSHLEEVRAGFSPMHGRSNNKSSPVRQHMSPSDYDQGTRGINEMGGTNSQGRILQQSPRALNSQNIIEGYQTRMCLPGYQKVQEKTRKKIENSNKIPAEEIVKQVEEHTKENEQEEYEENAEQAPPFSSITTRMSHDISAISEDSYHGMMRARLHELNYNFKANMNNEPYKNFAQEEAEKTKSCLYLPGQRQSSTNYYDDKDEHQVRSCIPARLQRFTQRRKNKDETVDTEDSSTKSFTVLRMHPERSTDDKTATDDVAMLDFTSCVYEYGSGMNTYIAYFDHSKDPRTAFKVIEHPSPPLLPYDSNEVLVKIEASTVSIADCHIRRGDWWNGSLSLPRIPGATFAGKVEQVSKKGKFQRGDQVLSLVTSGGNSRYVCIPKERLVKIPPTDSALAACLPEIYLSAFQALHHGQSSVQRYRKNSLSGKKVLVLGGATPVGRAVVELGREAGAIVYATVKEKQFSWVSEVGGFPLSRELNDWMHTIALQMDLLIGVDDVNALHEDLTYDHLNVLSKKGQLIIIGGPEESGKFPSIGPGKGVCHSDIFKILRRSITYNVFESWEKDMKQGKKDLSHIANFLRVGLLRPKILERIPLSKIGKAHALLEMRRLHGIIVCEPWIKENR